MLATYDQFTYTTPCATQRESVFRPAAEERAVINSALDLAWEQVQRGQGCSETELRRKLAARYRV